MSLGPLDQISDGIGDHRTRSFFEEIVRGYSVRNYRSVLPALWSVVVTDLLFKLQHAATVFGDAVAASILKDLDTEWKKHPNSPLWEEGLLKTIQERTSLFDPGDYDGLSHLQKQRHLCAHPVLSAAEVLFTPTREEVLAHIRRALEAVLTKPAMLSTKMFDSFMADLDSLGETLKKENEIKRFIEAKYLPVLRPAAENVIVRSLWRVTFRAEGEQPERNRNMNRLVLNVFFGRRANELGDYIAHHRDYFSDVAPAVDDRMTQLVWFLADHPRVASKLSDSLMVRIDASTKHDHDVHLLSWFRGPSMKDHLNACKTLAGSPEFNPTGRAFKRLCRLASELGVEGDAIDIGIELYGHASSFNSADLRFDAMIEPYIDKMTPQQFVTLFERIEKNSQVYGRRAAKADHRKLVSAAKKVLPSKFKWADYEALPEA